VHVELRATFTDMKEFHQREPLRESQCHYRSLEVPTAVQLAHDFSLRLEKQKDESTTEPAIQPIMARLGPLISEEELLRWADGLDLYRHCNQLALLWLLEYSGRFYRVVELLLHGMVDYLKEDAYWAGRPRYISCSRIADVVKYTVKADLNGRKSIERLWENTFSFAEKAIIQALYRAISEMVNEPSVGLTDIIYWCKLENRQTILDTVVHLERQGILEEQYGRIKMKIGLLVGWLSARKGNDEIFFCPASSIEVIR
jgi:hypothetical protein